MPKAPEPIRNAARAVRRTTKFDDDARCLLCGTPDPLVVTRLGGLIDAAKGAEPEAGTFRSKIRLVLEEHHLFEGTIDRDVKVPLCRNCHGLLHEALRDIGIDFKLDPEHGTVLHAIHTVLRILALFHEQLAKLLYSLADRLGDAIRALDRRRPGWGEIPGMA